jgi:hypothetical protein
LRHGSEGGLLFGLALLQLGARRVDADDRSLQLRLCFAALGHERRCVHLREHLASPHKIAFIGEYVLDAARDLPGYVDLNCLDAAVAAGEARGQRLRPQPLPRK